MVVIKIKRKLFMESTKNKWEEKAVLGPSIIRDDDVEHMFIGLLQKKYFNY